MCVLPILVTLGLAACTFACGDGHSDRDYYYGNDGTSGGGDGTPQNVTPLLVDVDTDKTMTAPGGDGVGIFVEYQTGGKGHVSWTCDTNKTNLSCAFGIKVAALSGQISNLAIDNAATNDLISQSDAQTITATTNTTTNTVSVNFAADPGGTIEITAQIGGVSDASYFFFVQNGQVNGGYTGQLTNPLRFEGKTP
ncbi:MAG TPA: hypothetical protein VF407_11105 [Polyangiaceae bacterium]